MLRALVVSLVVMLSTLVSGLQAAPAQDDSGNSPALRQTAPSPHAQGIQGARAPERDDPRVRLEWEKSIQGVPSLELKRKLHQLRLNRVAPVTPQKIPGR